MRVAALYDIHGNLPALEAVLAQVRTAAVDLVVVGGDVVPGPMPAETLSLLLELELPVRYLSGNGEREVLAIGAGREPESVSEAYRPAMRWVAERLGPEHRRILESWPGSIELEIDGLGSVLFCHATPHSDSEIATRLTPEHRFRTLFERPGVSLVVCGHTHMQFDRRTGGVRVVNAGSVGMPFAEPGAYWLLLAPEVQLQRTEYDLEQAAIRIRSSGYPMADDFAERNVLRPPSEEETLELFSRAEPG